ncbi:hypothetical protein [Bradyrhizobium canariense]|uniref:hypothetical protein n=1 Tax=Bradyrhizobium canariense TaxID=255045 RepID=UPI0011BA736C|nr:hypothetical protein [Bradyrhizobium canariense]
MKDFHRFDNRPGQPLDAANTDIAAWFVRVGERTSATAQVSIATASVADTLIASLGIGEVHNPAPDREQKLPTRQFLPGAKGIKHMQATSHKTCRWPEI